MNKPDIERAIEDVRNLKDMYLNVAGYETEFGDIALAILRAELALPDTDLQLAANLLQEYGLQALDLVQAFKRKWIPVIERMPAWDDSGHTVLVYYKNENGLGRRVRAKWVKAKTVESSTDGDIGIYDDETDTYYDPEGWYEKIDNWSEYTSVFISHEVTHWTPLPESPK